MSTALVIRAEIEPGMRLVLYRCPVKRCRQIQWCLTTTVERKPIRGTALWTGDKVYCRDRGHRTSPIMVEEAVQVLGDDLAWATPTGEAAARDETG